MVADKAIGAIDWIAADWGTSSLRLWACAADGSVIEHRSAPLGMNKLAPADFEGALIDLIGNWLPDEGTGPRDILICGMAGARQGWKEAAYRSVPCAPVSAGGLTRVETSDRRINVAIVPGLSQAQPTDVMRGEETQLAGLVAKGITNGAVCLPGTHSKWVSLRDGEITRFSTVMTGEIFALLSKNSILRHSMEGESSEGAFLAAVSRIAAHPERLPADLFSIRASGLIGQAGEGRDRLSGMLIGAELAACREYWQGQTVYLVGADTLTSRYGAAIARLGGNALIESGETLALSGLAHIRKLEKAEG